MRVEASVIIAVVKYSVFLSPLSCLMESHPQRASRRNKRSYTFNTFENYHHLVTMSEPLGRKGCPTMASRIELFPALWLPTVMMRGKEKEFLTPVASCNWDREWTKISKGSGFSFILFNVVLPRSLEFFFTGFIFEDKKPGVLLYWQTINMQNTNQNHRDLCKFIRTIFLIIAICPGVASLMTDEQASLMKDEASMMTDEACSWSPTLIRTLFGSVRETLHHDRAVCTSQHR